MLSRRKAQSSWPFLGDHARQATGVGLKALPSLAGGDGARISEASPLCEWLEPVSKLP